MAISGGSGRPCSPPFWNLVALLAPLAGLVAAAALLNVAEPKEFVIGGARIGLFAMAFAAGCFAGACAAWRSLRRAERYWGLGAFGLFVNGVLLVAFFALALIRVPAPW